MSESLKPIRVIDDPAASGAWNMAVDQAILESADQTGQPTLRIYRWQPATLSLGYFQSFDDRRAHVESRNCPVVRRASGGGAILHDREITYSLTIPSSNRWAAENTEIYKIVHECIVAILAGYEIEVRAYDDNVDPPPKSGNDFLCFQRRSNGDLIFDGHKVVGSAQRRSKTTILQHGSILMQTSEYAPQLPGIFEISGYTFEQSEFVDRVLVFLCKALKLSIQPGELSELERAAATRLSNVKFENDDWNIHRVRS